MLDRLKIKSSFVDGLRVTDGATVEIVEMVLSGSINKQIVASINDAGGTAVGLSGKDGRLITGKAVETADSGIPIPISSAFLISVLSASRRRSMEPYSKSLAASAVIPVIAPIAAGRKGETFNINADTAAGAMSPALLGASKLIMLTDVPGILDKGGQSDQRIEHRLRHGGLVTEKTVSGGMIPKVETCLAAIKSGCGAAHILDGRVPHALLARDIHRARHRHQDSARNSLGPSGGTSRYRQAYQSAKKSRYQDISSSVMG